MTNYRVAIAAPEQLPQVCAVLAEAMREDPIYDRLMPGTPRDRAVARFAQLEYLKVRTEGGVGTVDVATDDDGRIIAGALWIPPIPPRMPLIEKLPLVPGFLRALGARAHSVLGTDRTYLRSHPRAPHWYLSLVGTAAGARGHGAATALLHHRLSVIDAGHGAAALEASTRGHVAYYERFGFEELGPLPVVRGSNPVVMWRAAR